MGFSQAQTVVAAGFIPDTAETVIVPKGETQRATEAKGTSGFYEAVLLAVSFVFLLLGLLPSHAEQLSGSPAPGEERGKESCF
jgi:hypothetical protein